MVSQTNMQKGRIRQKFRTRKALLQAAWELLKKGQQPSVEEVAERAMVSRATAYRYFPNRERLLIEAVLNRDAATPKEVLAGVDSGQTAEAVARVQQHLYSQVIKNETLHRSLLRACQEEWIENKDRFVLRGDQRLVLLESALHSRAENLNGKDYEKLLFALATMVSVESYVVLRDVCQVTQKRGREIMNWAVRTLVKAVLPGDAT
jgi:AcrR family transcriptional regulator